MTTSSSHSTIEQRIAQEKAEALPPLDPSRAQTEADADRVAAAAAAGDPLAAQAMTNAAIAAESHPEPAPTRQHIDVAEDARDVADELRTGKTVIRQRGHLEQR